MKRPMILLVLCFAKANFAQFPDIVKPHLDRYGGDVRYACPQGARDYFYTYRDAANHHWWYCDPDGHRFVSLAVDVADTLASGRAYAKATSALYGGFRNTCVPLLKRLQGLGFNTVGVYSSWLFLPVRTQAGPSCAVQEPFIYLINPGERFRKNALDRYFKDVVSTAGPIYKGWRGGVFPDVWDPNWSAVVNLTGNGSPWGRSNPFPSVAALDSSPWLIGVSIDDTDQVWGTRGTAPEMQQPVTSWYVAVSPPVQIYSGRWNLIYSDPLMHAKQEWANWLQANTGVTPEGNATRSSSKVTLRFRRGHPFTIHDLLTLEGCSDHSFNTAPGHPVTVTSVTADSVTYMQAGADSSASACTAAQGPGYTLQALNAAWGSSYTTFGSTAGSVSAESVGTGDGTQTRFTHTLVHHPADPFSLAIVIAGRAVGGDCPWFEGSFCQKGLPEGTGAVQAISGSDVTGGSIDYRTGEISVTLGKAPSAGTAITLSYLYDGWPHQVAGGRGLLDEDGSNSWFPNNQRLPELYGHIVPQVDRDLDDFEDHLFQKYYQTLAAAVRAVLPHHLVFSNDWVGPHDRPGVIRQAGRYCDVLIVGEAPNEDEITRNIYDVVRKPLQRFEMIEGSPDSSLNSHPCTYAGGNGGFPAWTCQPTQKARGQRYMTQMRTTLGLQGLDGYGYFIGWNWWQMADNASEMQNYGLFSFLDNAYDGIEDRMQRSKDRYGYPRGGEPGDYGDFISSVRAANLLWLGTEAAPNPR
jgi:hypothetical protein